MQTSRTLASVSVRFFSTTAKQTTLKGPFRFGIMGAPGVGKGTFASRLSPYFNIPTISTGDLIRAEIKNGTPIGREVKAMTERGELVKDEIVFQLLKKRLSEKDCLENGYILDGYPRRVSQAETLIANHINLQLTINLNLDKNILIEKALARRVCEGCGNGYNIASIMRDGYHMPPLLPKVEGKCDKCGGKLVQRSDDTESVIRNRLDIYENETKPILSFYADKKLLCQFDVKKGVADLPDLIQLIEREVVAKRGF